MPGVRGMVSSRPRKNAIRNKMWMSMRIMRRFTVPDLCRTTGATVSNVRKFVQRLRAHGYIAPIGKFIASRPGSFQAYRLAKDCGPEYPMRCDVCGRPLGQPCEKENKNDEK